jgi:membrane protease YdiL (CAAX protease family)
VNRVSASPLGWALAAGVFAVIALAGYWIVLFQIVRTPPNVLPDLSKYPSLTVALVLATSSLVSPIVEEVGFRGYCQQILEYFLADLAFGAIAYLTNSILANIPVHIAADAVFFHLDLAS